MFRTKIVRVVVSAALALAAALFSFAPVCVAQAQERPIADRNEAVLSLLQSTVVDANYDRVDLEKVIQDLRDAHKLNIHVSWTALEQAGIRRDRRIEARLKQVTLGTLLDIILREAAAGTNEQLLYHVDDGVLVISTSAAAREDTVLRTYDVADLMESGYAVRRFANTPVLGLALTGREFVGGETREVPVTGMGGGGGGGGGGGVIGDPGEEPSRPRAMELIQRIVELVIESVEPESWQDNGGDIGSIRVFGSTLLVRHTIRTHQRIDSFLSLLRNSRAQPLDAEAAVVRLRADKAAQWRQEVGAAFPRLTADQASRLALATSSESVLYRASTSGFNGQGMWLSAVTQQEVLTGAKPIVGDGINAFAPISANMNDGIELTILPLVSPGSEEVTLDVQMAWIPSTQVHQRPITLAPGANDSTIDQTQRSMRTVSSTAQLKIGDALAMSIPAQVDDKATNIEWEDWLVVRVHKPAE